MVGQYSFWIYYFSVCHLLGDFLEAVDRDQDKAFKVYQENCETGNFARSCYKCATYTASGQGGQKKDLLKVSF